MYLLLLASLTTRTATFIKPQRKGPGAGHFAAAAAAAPAAAAAARATAESRSAFGFTANFRLEVFGSYVGQSVPPMTPTFAVGETRVRRACGRVSGRVSGSWK